MSLAVTNIAQACHEVNRVICVALGDNSQQHWEDAPEWQRNSAIAGVESFLKNPEMTAEALHASWVEHKIKDGWVYGEKKNPELKTHPCMVPYHDLPASQQLKDHAFQAVIVALA